MMAWRLLPVLTLGLIGALAGAVAAADAPAVPADTSPVVEPIEKAAPLVIAARNSDAPALRTLLAAHPAADVNQRTADGTSALHWAVYHGDADLVATLLAAGADVNARNDYGSTPMAEAAIRGNVKILNALLAAHADVDSANDGRFERSEGLAVRRRAPGRGGAQGAGPRG